MAKKKAESSGSESIMRYDEEMAKLAGEYADQVADLGGGEFFTTKGSVLKFNDAPLPFNQVGAVIVDFVFVNAFYKEKFNPNNTQQPICYAFGRKGNEKEIVPHKESVDKKCDDCTTCEFNVFGSGEGRGKRCKNMIRLALLPAGTYESETKFKAFDDEEQFEKGKVGYLMVPPTSLAGFGGFTKQVQGSLGLPPAGIFTRVKLVPSEGGGFEITFEPIAKVPKDLFGIIIKRNAESRKLIEFPFPKPNDDAPAKSAGKGKKSGKKGF